MTVRRSRARGKYVSRYGYSAAFVPSVPPIATIYSRHLPYTLVGPVVGEFGIESGDALLVIDMQVDFLPGGALAVPNGEAAIEPLNRCIAAFTRAGHPVFCSRDWHPQNHCSFVPQGGPWPPHCVAGTNGARFAPALHLPDSAHVISKATGAQRDAYSAFQETDLARELRARNVRRVFVGGLATDYCVLATVLDARASGFEVVVLTDAIRAVDVQPGDGERALEKMCTAGARLTDSAYLHTQNEAAA
jgi:nicotinamidase/pyrazinamidase